jgi:alpha-galactosidase
VYVNVDDTWEGQRDAQGVIHSNDKFPDMKALGDYIHSRGLKFGIYSSPGPKTCAGYEASYGHEEQDAKTYASWGVDYLKYDLCSFHGIMAKADEANGGGTAAGYKLMIAAYKKMGDALKATGRPIVYSLCQYGVDDVWAWGPSVGAQLWRTTDDIDDSYGRMITIGLGQADLNSYAGHGHWNDPDMLEVGNGKMTTDEYRTHMSLWALLAAPLLAGNDLSRMSDADKSILMNHEVIAIDQDKLGVQARRIYQHGDFSAWARPLSGGRVAVGLINTSWSVRDLSVSLKELGLTGSVKAHDVWAGKDLGPVNGTLSARIPKHGVALFVLSR